ncbi:PhnA domain-containing protein [Chitinophaga horti]|uniref:PhnA domain-containing protein n=1 Tax=Chitinophaga horti TaxID=2920382 RepID=A0ABY6IU95_9BACT|nr:alkylphosphonate utilization protein [Chitinophaga horti]UYQ90951.1 PhnA domain-containing protein [Chitinophaga horti]
MKIADQVAARSQQQCELCASTDQLSLYEVPPSDYATSEYTINICNNCRTQIDKKAPLDQEHWRCLTTSMWSEVPGVQVVAWRMLNRLRTETWAMESLDMLYLPDELLDIAKATGDHENDGAVDLHRDVNGALLNDGDTVILTKSLDVKGSTLNAKLGTVVKNIRLVPDNTEQIEGKIEGQTIVILTKYLRKQA